MAKTRRIQIMLEPEQFARLKEVALRADASYSSIVRDALDRHVPLEVVKANVALDRFLDSPPVWVEGWAPIKQTIRREAVGLE